MAKSCSVRYDIPCNKVNLQHQIGELWNFGNVELSSMLHVTCQTIHSKSVDICCFHLSL